MQALRPTSWLTDFTGVERVELVWAEVQKLRALIRVYAAKEKKWNSDLVSLMCEEYARFLLVKLALADDMCKLLAVPHGIRWVWERHLLHNSKHYEKFQTLLDGHLGFVEHPTADENARRGITWHVYSLAFGKYPPCEVWQPPANQPIAENLAHEPKRREQDNLGDTPCSSTSLRDEERKSGRRGIVSDKTAEKMPKNTKPSVAQPDPMPVPTGQVEVTRADGAALPSGFQRPPIFPASAPDSVRNSGLSRTQKPRIISSITSSPKSPLFSDLRPPRFDNMPQQMRMASAPPSLNFYQLPPSTPAIQAEHMASQRINFSGLESSQPRSRATAANLSLSDQKIPTCDTRPAVGASDLQNLPMGKSHSALSLSGPNSPRYLSTPPSPSFNHVPVQPAHDPGFSGFEHQAVHSVEIAATEMVLAASHTPHAPDPESAIVTRAAYVTPHVTGLRDVRTEDVAAIENPPRATDEARIPLPSIGRYPRQPLGDDCSMNPPTTPVTPSYPEIARSAERQPELTDSRIRQPALPAFEKPPAKFRAEPRRIQWLREEAQKDDSSVECVTPLQPKRQAARPLMRKAMCEPERLVRSDAKSEAGGAALFSLRSANLTPQKRLNADFKKRAPTEIKPQVPKWLRPKSAPEVSNQTTIDVDSIARKPKKDDQAPFSLFVQRQSGSHMRMHIEPSPKGSYAGKGQVAKRARPNSAPKDTIQRPIDMDSMDSNPKKADQARSSLFVQRQSGSHMRVHTEPSLEGSFAGKCQVAKRARPNSAPKDNTQRTIDVDSMDSNPKKADQARSSLFVQRQSGSHKRVRTNPSLEEGNSDGISPVPTIRDKVNKTEADAGRHGSASQSTTPRTSVPPLLKVGEIEKEGRVRIWLRQSKKPGPSRCAGRPSGKPWIGMDGIKTRYTLTELATKLRAYLERALVGQKLEMYAETDVSCWGLLYCGRDGVERAIEGDGMSFREVLLREGYMHSKLPTLNVVVVTGPKKPT